MKAVSYNGITFSSLNVNAGIPDDLPGPDVSPVLIERFGTAPLFAGLSRGARTIPVVFSVKPGYSAETTLMTLLAKLDPYDESERVLAATLNDGTSVYCNAAVGSFVYLAVNQMQVSFHASEPNWKKTSRRYSPGSTVSNYTTFTANGSLTVQNDGQVPALPVVRMKWTGTQRTSDTNYVGWKYRRTFTITNNGTRTLRRYPVRLDLDDTRQWVLDGKALASGNDIRVFANGVQLPRQLYDHNVTYYAGTSTSGTETTVTVTGAGWTVDAYAGKRLSLRSGALKDEGSNIVSNTSTVLTVSPAFSDDVPASTSFRISNTYCWTVIDELQAGASIKLEVVYGNPSAGSPPTLGSLPDMPAIDLGASNNGTWVYRVGSVPDGDSGRGLWYVSPVGGALARTSWDQPGAWSRFSYLDNRDDRTQARVTRKTVGTYTVSSSTTTTITIATTPWTASALIGARVTVSGQSRIITANTTSQITFSPKLSSAPAGSTSFTIDYNAGLFDAKRTWRDNARYSEEGAYDGVALSHPLGIKRIQAGYSITNPAGIAKVVLGSRASGAEDWTFDLEDKQSVFTATSGTIDVKYVSGAYPVQLLLALIPQDDVEIPTTLAKETGTASAAATTSQATLEDANKSWVTNQWKNGTVRIVGGPGKGQRRTISSNTGTVITASSNWTTALDTKSRYVLTANHEASVVLTGSQVTLTLDTTNLTVGTISSEADVYDVGTASGSNRISLRMGGGASADQYPYDRVVLGGASRRLFMATDEYLELDCANRTVYLRDSTDALVASVPWVATFERLYKSGATVLTARTVEWLPVRANDSTLYVSNPYWGGSALRFEVDLEEAFLG